MVCGICSSSRTPSPQCVQAPRDRSNRFGLRMRLRREYKRKNGDDQSTQDSLLFSELGQYHGRAKIKTKSNELNSIRDALGPRYHGCGENDRVQPATRYHRISHQVYGFTRGGARSRLSRGRRKPVGALAFHEITGRARNRNRRVLPVSRAAERYHAPRPPGGPCIFGSFPEALLFSLRQPVY
jgi:hypothetical protein